MKALRLVAVVGVLLTTAGCARDGASRAAPLPKAPPVVPVTMTEYRFALEGDVPSGRVVFRVRNAGRLHHRVTLVALPEDLPPIDVQLGGTERRYIEPFAGMPERAPATTSSFAVDLEPATRYAFICFTVDRDNQNHAEKGMATEFRSAGRPTATTAPSGPAPGSAGGGDQEPSS